MRMKVIIVVFFSIMKISIIFIIISFLIIMFIMSNHYQVAKRQSFRFARGSGWLERKLEELKKAADNHDDELAGEQEKIVSCPFFGCKHGINHCSISLYHQIIITSYLVLLHISKTLIHHCCIATSAKMTVGKRFPAKLIRRKKQCQCDISQLEAMLIYFNSFQC